MKLCLVVLLLCGMSGCYASAQRASYVTGTEAIDAENGISQDMSLSADVYEFVVGAQYSRLTAFAGIGVGVHQVHYRTSGNAFNSDEDSISNRVHAGGLVHLVTTHDITIAAVGLVAVSVGGDSQDANGGAMALVGVTRSTEFGLQFSVDKDLEEWGDSVGPLLRVSYASQSGRSAAQFYANENGEPKFESTGVVVTLGLQYEFGEEFLW